MIKKIFILRECGICLNYIDYAGIQTKANGNNNKDPQLISGFFSALMTFADETISSGKSESNMSFISIRNTNYYFLKVNHRFYIVETDSNDKTMTMQDFEELLNQICVIVEEYIKTGLMNEDVCEEDTNTKISNDIRNVVAKALRKSLFKCAGPNVTSEIEHPLLLTAIEEKSI